MRSSCWRSWGSKGLGRTVKKQIPFGNDNQKGNGKSQYGHSCARKSSIVVEEVAWSMRGSFIGGVPGWALGWGVHW